MSQVNKYHNAKIYKITSANTDKIYVGSTTMALKTRLYHHLKQYNKWLKKMLISKITSFEIIEMNDYKIELIEAYKCDNNKELISKENYYLRLYKDIIVNKQMTGRTRKEYAKDNEEKIKNYKKQYDIDNKEKHKQYRQDNKDKRDYRINCICGAETSSKHKARHERTQRHINLINKTD